MLNKYGIYDINLDLIYGINTQTIKDLQEDINKYLSLNITHISTYSLILEGGTILYNNKYKVIDEDTEYDMYCLIKDKLEKNEFINYEVSNYSKEGYQSIHNLVYWDNKEYYGFGIGAASYIKDKRFTCFNNIRKYITKIYEYEIELIDKKKKEEYEYILGFRKIDGINIDKFIKRYNKSPLDNKIITKLIKEKKLLIKDNNLYINPLYMYISNEILLELISWFIVII